MKSLLKRLRGWRPVNAVATGGVRLASRASRRTPAFAVKHLPRVGPVRARLPDGKAMRLWSKGDDWVANQVWWRGWAAYEAETAPLFYVLARDARVTLDVGAFVGYYTLLAGLAARRGSVLAFEPMPVPYERLKRNVELNRLDNVECFHAAVSDTDGSAEFFHLPSDIPASSSLSAEFMRSHPDVRATTVPTVALDDFLEERGVAHVDLVKLDVESCEPEALRGMEASLDRDHPRIICEVLSYSGVERQLDDLLRPLGYRFFHLTPDGPVLRDAIEGHPSWRNYLFTTDSADVVDAAGAAARRAVST